MSFPLLSKSDGSAHFATDTTDAYILEHISTMAGGEVVTYPE